MRARLVTLGVLAVLFIVALVLGGIYADWLWYASVGLQSILATTLIVKVLLFFGAAIVFFVVWCASTFTARRLSHGDHNLWQFVASIEGRATERLFTGVLILMGLVLAVIMGAAASGQWDTVLRYALAIPFETIDPIYGRDVSFYVFLLPFYRFLHSWLVGLVALVFIGTAAVYTLRLIVPQLPASAGELGARGGTVHIQLSVSRGVKAHLSLLGAALLLLLAWHYWLSRYELLLTQRRAIFGAGYTDVHANQPMLLLLFGVSILAAGLLVANVFRRGHLLSLTGGALLVLAMVLGGGIYPSIVQRFEVQPSELDKEKPYIESHIQATRTAYALDRIAEQPYPAEESLTLADLQANRGSVNNVRLLDPNPLLDTYNQIQSIRAYYEFGDIDVDRYIIDGEYRQVMLSAREMNASRLSSEAQTWVNRRLKYTHGYGVAASLVNAVSPEGLPNLIVQDVPPKGKLQIDRPEIYYGERDSDYVVVNTGTPEFDYPKGDENAYSDYQGDSGIQLNGYLTRLLFSWQLGDANLMLSSYVGQQSKLLMHRDIRERTQKIAPFLLYDRDPYLVIADGRLYWLQDAYTYSDHYPYSQPVQARVNYMRNSVKVVTDAYDGSVRFFIADDTDPIIRTYAAAFPQLFSPIDQMPAEIRSHVRYPEDLFSVQARMYSIYHMQDARVFYNREDAWTIPQVGRGNQLRSIEPYYVILRLPDEPGEEFALILPYTPPNKNNMITWLAARSDGANYGRLVALKYSKDKLIYGPLQVEARIDQDTRISEQLSLWDQAGSRVIRGNMTIIPIGKSNLYVEPIYLQAEQSSLPEMKRVVLAAGNRVVMEQTVSAAIASLFATEITTTPGVSQPQPSAQPPQPSGSASNAAIDLTRSLQERYGKIQSELKDFEADLRRLSDMLQRGP